MRRDCVVFDLSDTKQRYIAERTMAMEKIVINLIIRSIFNFNTVLAFEWLAVFVHDLFTHGTKIMTHRNYSVCESRLVLGEIL